jgi:large subunit ribosomal protein L25
MAEQYILDVSNRTVVGKQVSKLRRQDLIPAVIYGSGGPSINLSCPRRPLEILLSRAGGTHVVSLNVDGKTESALVREVNRDPIRRDLIHVDFLRVDLTKKLRAEVPLRFVGHPKLGADMSVAEYMTQIEVECLPADIPDHIDINIEHFKTAGDSITVKDLPAISSVTYLADSHDVIVRIELAAGGTAEDLAADAAAAAAAAEPELAKTKGKKEEEEA